MKRSYALALAALFALGLLYALRDSSAPARPPAHHVEPPTPVVARPPLPQSPDARGVSAAADAAVVVRNPADGAVVVSGAWGSAPGMFGREPAHESNPEGPMALTIAPDGTVVVVDQVNRRIQRFQHGALVSTIELSTAATQDVSVSRDGTVVSLDRLVGQEVRLTFTSGESRSVSVVGGPITEGGAVSGVFSDAEGVWVEREHQEVIRVADASGSPDARHTSLYGRPTRDGEHTMRAAIVDRFGGVVSVSVASRENGAMDWSTNVGMGATVLNVLMLDSDLAGRIYLGASVATVIPGPTPTIRDERVVVARLNDAGAVTGMLQLPAISGEDEVFRPLTVDDAGAVYEMVHSARGMEVRRWVFPE